MNKGKVLVLLGTALVWINMTSPSILAHAEEKTPIFESEEASEEESTSEAQVDLQSETEETTFELEETETEGETATDKEKIDLENTDSKTEEIVNEGNQKGWLEEDGYWFYYENGEPVSEAFRTINGAIYYFDADGIMQVGTFIVYNEETESEKFYLADMDGRLYTKFGWMQLSNEWYYIKSDYSILADGFYEVGGSEYYFGVDGAMATGLIKDWESGKGYVYYVACENGIVYKRAGWNQIGSRWYYMRYNGSILINGIYQIDGNSYYFDNAGKMQTGSFLCYDKVAKKEKRYLADESGVVLNKQGWAQHKGEWYYINADSSLVTNEFRTIGEGYYYFDSVGVLQTGLFSIYDEYGCSTSYLAYDSGAIRKPGWAEYRGAWYYIQSDRTLITDGFQEIDGTLYYFETDGRMQNGQFLVYDEEIGEYRYYAATNWGAVWAPGWQYQDGIWYYVKNDRSIVVEEFQKVNGSSYYFDSDGKMVTGLWKIGENSYYFGKDGKLVVNKWIQNATGWNYAGENGCFVNGWQTIKGCRYYFENERMMTDAKQIDGKVYIFYSDGRLEKEIKETGWFLVDGKWYYYLSDGRPYTGWMNHAYYIENGKMKTECVVKAENELEKYTYVDYLGQKKKGWIRNEEIFGEAWLYADENGALEKNEWKQINGAWYYFDNNFFMISNGIYEIDGRKSKFAADGKWLGYLTEKGWVLTAGKWYYVDLDGSLSTGAKVIKGQKYFFNSDGAMDTNSISWDGDTIIWVNENGVRDRKNGWKQGKDGWFYVQDEKVYVGWLELNNRKYFMSPEMNVGLIQTPDQGWKIFDGNGVCQADKDGWRTVEINGKTEWFYLKNGTPVSGCQESYLFQDNGLMVTGIYKDASENYLFDENGHLMKNGWKQYDGKWYYADSNGKLYTGERKINGKTYWFNSNGVWVK